MLEVRALAKATDVLRQAQDIRGGKPTAVIVLSMVGKNYRLTQDMKDAAAALDLPLASKPMILRQIYADAPGQGAVVWNLGARRHEAASEVDQLFREILPDACTRASRRQRTARPSGRSRDSRRRNDMAERRTLIEGSEGHRRRPIDPNKEKEFVFGEQGRRQPSHPPHRRRRPPSTPRRKTGRVPLSTRMRGDFAAGAQAGIARTAACTASSRTRCTDILEAGGRAVARANGYLT